MKISPSCLTVATGIALSVLLVSCARPDLPAAPDISLDGYPPAIHRQLAVAMQRVAKKPYNPEANGRMGMLLHTYDQLLGAGIYYRRAALLDTDDFRWPYLRSWIQSELGNDANALDSLQKALAIKPDYPRARIRLAELYLTNGQLADCRNTLDSLLHDSPDQSEAYFIQAQLALRESESSAAIDALDRVRQLTGHFGALHHAYAQAYRLLGDEASMQRHTHLAEQFSNTRADIADPVMAAMLGLNISTTKRIERALGFARYGDISRAETILLQALEDDPDNLPLHVTLAGLYGGQGDFAKADQHLEQAAAIDADHPRLHYSTGIARLAEQRFTESEQAFRRSLKLDPDNADTWAQLGLLQTLQGRNTDAVASYNTALEFNPWHQQSHWMLGRQGLEADNADTAIEHLSILRPMRDPTAAAILLDLGRAYQMAGNTTEAVAVLREAIDAATQYGDDQSRSSARGLLRRLDSD